MYLLAEQRLLRDALARLLRRCLQINVVGVSGRVEIVKDEILGSDVEVVLTDFFDLQTSQSFLAKALTQDSDMKLVLFGMDDDRQIFLKAVHVGICAYLLKEASAAEIIAAVRAAFGGEATFPPKLCMTLLQFLSSKAQDGSPSPEMHVRNRKALTSRQIQLIRLLDEGLTNKEIAARLHLSPFTVKNHLRRVMRQFQAISRRDVAGAVRASGQLVPR